VVDTLRADHTVPYGHDRPTSPNLDRLPAEAWIRFDQAFSHSPWTLPSFASLLTSLPPPVHKAGSRFTGTNPGEPVVLRLKEATRTAPEILGEDHGFRTAAFVNNAYLAPDFGLGAGFEHYDHAQGSNQRSRSAAEVVDRAVRWISQLDRGERFFVLVHLFDPHLDYDPPASFAAAFAGSEWARERPDPRRYSEIIMEGVEPGDAEKRVIEALYDAEIAYVDEQIGRFLEALEELDLLGSTAVMITADHGEELWDHGGFEHGHSLYNERGRMPLWLKLADTSRHRAQIPSGGDAEELICHVDVLPTLLDELGVETDVPLLGRSYFSRDKASDACYLGFTLYGNRFQGIVTRGFKLIENQNTGALELYDLSSDPGERRDLAQSRPELVEELRGELALLETELGRLGNSLRSSAPAPLDPQTLERLRAMGYIR